METSLQGCQSLSSLCDTCRLAEQKQSVAYYQECGECEVKCPQKIPIIARLNETHQALRKRAAD